MKTKVKNFIFNGLTYGIIFSLLDFIPSYYVFNFALKASIYTSVSIGIAAFLVNGLIQSRFTKSSKVLHAITIPMQDSETLRISTPANHIVNDDLLSGKLFLTEKRLVFKSFEQIEYSWLLDDLNSFKFHLSIFNAGGEFIVENCNHDKLVFEVDEIRHWRKALAIS